jgi:hypothetical protein
VEGGFPKRSCSTSDLLHDPKKGKPVFRTAPDRLKSGVIGPKPGRA